MEILTPAEVLRALVAEVFRAFSRGENVSAKAAEPAVLWLRNLRGLGFPKFKEERDCIFFISDCWQWFLSMRKAFAKASDAEVLQLVAERFREYLKARDEAAIPKPDMPWRAEPLPPSPLVGSGLVKNGGLEEMNWKSLKPADRTELAHDAREMKHDPLAQGLKKLKRKAQRAEVYRFLLAYMERRLRVEIDRQHDPELRREALWRFVAALEKSRPTKTISK